MLRKNSDELSEAEMLKTWDEVVDKLYKGLGSPDGLRKADLHTSLMYFTGLRAANIWGLTKSGALDGELLSRATQGFFLAARAGADYRGMRNIIKALGKLDVSDPHKPRLMLEYLDDIGTVLRKGSGLKTGDNALGLTDDEAWLKGAREMLGKLMRAPPFSGTWRDFQWMRAVMEVRVVADIVRYAEANPGRIEIEHLAPRLTKNSVLELGKKGQEGIDLVVKVDGVRYAVELKKWDPKGLAGDTIKRRLGKMKRQVMKHGDQIMDLDGVAPSSFPDLECEKVLYVFMGRQSDEVLKVGRGSKQVSGTMEEHLIKGLGKYGFSEENFLYMGVRDGPISQAIEQSLSGHLNIGALIERLSNLGG